LGLFEIIIILAVALIVLGPERMPEVVRLAMQIIREVRTAANEAMREITEAIEQESPSQSPSTQHPPSPPDVEPGSANDKPGLTGDKSSPVQDDSGLPDDKPRG
jgi:Tat protein translocase TatB subunit